MVQTVETGTDKLIAEVEGAVGRIVFNNPERHNAITTDMFAALAAVVDAYEQDAKIRVVVVSGAGGRAFASGADIGNLDSARGPSRNPSPDDARTSRGPAALGRLTKPLIAAVDGYCLGGGLLVALHADLLVATDRSKFGIPAARLGVGYPIEGVEQLVGRVGDANAARILMTGDRVGAEEAASMGLAHKVVPDDELDDEVEQLCSRLVANAPLTLRAVKLSIASAAGRGDRQTALDAIADCWASEDFAEGRAAFSEHREPRFRGR
ncbi:MAG: enoyl-CoA hydratase-related protein [bacterium]|nr:enoyl-CoA hydratase-related protein [bacterium]MYB08466.1 enoyl-CoA hydratase [Acidimicrobiia bacterium]MYG59587.1 enoyl-CoA hydratase [Acidimicrobiia bacterium]MYJ31671.1 enoyl-CoA hydratase [Acidimicrobiia bacterium]